MWRAVYLLASELLSFVKTAGYNIIGQPDKDGELKSISKKGALFATGDISVTQINESGAELERWLLKNAWIKEIDFSEVDYSNDDLSEVTLKIRYDWAEFRGKQGTLFSLA